MKKVHLVIKVNENGNVVGRILAYSSRKEAEVQKDYLNQSFSPSVYIVETISVY